VASSDRGNINLYDADDYDDDDHDAIDDVNDDAEDNDALVPTGRLVSTYIPT